LSVEQIFQDEINEFERWINTAEGIYKRDLIKRIEVINWVLENLKSPDICAIIESRMKEIIIEINKKNSIIEKDPLDSELRILDWTLYQVCSNEVKI
jgi:hypothetical protein